MESLEAFLNANWDREPQRGRLGLRFRLRPEAKALLLISMALLTFLSPLSSVKSRAQTFGSMKGFKVAEPYPAPNEKQTKSLLEAGKAVLVPGGALLSEGVTLQAFTVTNTLQLVVRAEHCFYNSSNHSVNSAGPLQMQTADGKFRIEGEGFFWQQTNSSLIVSNKVHTLIQADLLQSASTNRVDSASPSDTGPLTILSDRFKYDGSSGLGIWQDNVRVNGTNLALSSATLTALVPMGERQVHSLVAEQAVVIDYYSDGLHATGERLNYAPDTGLARLSQRATWRAQLREGRGDELVIDRSNHLFQVNGNAWLKLPGQAVGESGFLVFSNSSAPSPSSSIQRSIEIVCQRYEIRTNSAVFHDRVRLEEYLDNAVRGRMTCRQMTAGFGGTNELQTIVADKDVLIDEEDKQEGKHFSGGRAVYTHTNATLEISQHPKWRAGLRDGQGDLLRLNTQLNEMQVKGNALLRLPANQLAGQLSSTNRIATSRPPKNGTNEIAEIYCEEYTLRTNTSVFIGGVYVTHPEMNWSCEKLTVDLPVSGTTNLVAQGNVDFNLLTQNGMIHGTGDNAVYSFGMLNTTNGPQPIDELRLTGTPAFLEITNRTVQNPVVIWDRARDKLTVPGGEYRIQGTGPALGTNTFELPNSKLRK
jgi:lipopolysaccharide export system protein LptA